MSDVVLALTSPHMTGDIVQRTQVDMNHRLDAWGGPSGAHVDVDGDWGMHSRDRAEHLLYGLGVDKSMAAFDGVSSSDRLKLRYGWDHLTAEEQDRHKARADWRTAFVHRFTAGDGAIDAALKFGRAHVGVTEHPAGSNTGPVIDVWEHDCGIHAAPWCGVFLNEELKAGGFPNQPWLIFCPTIEARAKAGTGGWRWSSTAVKGAAVLYGEHVAEHVGFVAAVAHGVDTETIEGNTSTGPGGSQSNGGIVAIRHRHQDGSLSGFPIRGYAIPPWKGLGR